MMAHFDGILNRFFNYVKIDTQSDPTSQNCPSSIKQLTLGKFLVNELTQMGLSPKMDSNGYIMAKIPSNVNKKVPVIGFISHMDTSPDFSGTSVEPIAHPNYKGQTLNLSDQTVLDPIEFPELKNYIGQTLITASGNTLLGADDKAGITAIVSAAEYLLKHPEIKHGDIMIGFTPDEEIGRGANHFDVAEFGADFAYTIDGGEIGELEFENFNAAFAKITFQGRNVHPGSAKEKMVNSQLAAMEFNSLLPVNERPEYTENYEGFFHLISMKGSVEETVIEYIVRDHDHMKFEIKKELLNKTGKFISEKTKNLKIEIEIKDQYYNMKEKISDNMHIIELAKKAYLKAGVTPIIKPIRGGTDGSRLSFMGLPCPNIFAGGHNFHGRYEFVPLESIEKSTEIIVNIVRMAAE